MYDKAKFYYDNGIWSKDMLRKLVKKGKLTAKEYLSITGEVYV